MAQIRISAWAIRNPSPIALLFLALVIAGVVAYFRLPIKNLPDVEFPGVAITATLPGAAAAEMESQVTRPMENALSGVPAIDSMQSIVTEGVSTTVVQFAMGTDLQKMMDDVRSKVDQARNDLPREIDEPRIQRLEISNGSIIDYAVDAPTMSMLDLSWFIDDTVTRRLQALGGVGQITRFGGLDREVNIILDPVRMAAEGITAPQVNAALNSVTVDSSGGRVSIGGRDQTVRVLGAAASVADIRNLTISAGGRQVHLSDIAEVGDGSAEIRGASLLDGRPVVGFGVSKTKASSEVDVEEVVDASLAKLTKERPEIKVTKIVSQVKDTRESFEATRDALLEGMVLAAFVVLIFLRDWRATLITVVAMPVSLIPTFLLMSLFGFSLNTITLLALTLVIGILVDDAIVEIENIEKRVHKGIRPYQASIEGADQIGLAVVATTFAIFAVFVPVSFMPGIPGKFFKEFGLTVCVAVLFSLVVARLLTPLLAAYFLKPKPARERPPPPRIYTASLTWALNHKIMASILGGGLFIGSIVLAVLAPLPVGLSPEGNPDNYILSIETAPGQTLEETTVVTQTVVDLIKKRPETRHIFVRNGVGTGNAGGNVSTSTNGGNRATINVVIDHDRKQTVSQLRDELRPQLNKIPDARMSFVGSNFGSGGVQILLTSDNGQGLDFAALELQRQMRTLKILGNPRSSEPPSGPELVIKPKMDQAARLGVTTQAIAQVARVATAGDIDANVPKLNDGERRVPVRVRLPKDVRTDLSAIANLQVPTATGGFTSLASVADIDFRPGPGQIDRFDRKRQITVTADLVGGAQLGDATSAVHNLPIMKNLPAGVREASQGEAQALSQLLTGFVIALASGIFLVYGVMVLLFESFFKPVTILFALPLALVGAVVALLVMRLQLDMPALIGFLMLMGLAAKNSILLVEYAIERERDGATTREAILEATRERARPIVMTTLAMMGGMMPTALAFGAGSEFRQPMAVAVIGGLISSTLLSLVLVPAIYEIVDSVERWVKPLFGKLVTPREAPEPKQKPESVFDR